MFTIRYSNMSYVIPRGKPMVNSAPAELCNGHVAQQMYRTHAIQAQDSPLLPSFWQSLKRNVSAAYCILVTPQDQGGPGALTWVHATARSYPARIVSLCWSMHVDAGLSRVVRLCKSKQVNTADSCQSCENAGVDLECNLS